MHSGTMSQPTLFVGRNASAPMPPPISAEPETTRVRASPRTRKPASAAIGTSVTASAAESGRIAHPTTSSRTTPKRSAVSAPETRPSTRIGRAFGRESRSASGGALDHVFHRRAATSGTGAWATKIARHENAWVSAPPTTGPREALNTPIDTHARPARRGGASAAPATVRTSAPANPCTARAASRTAIPPARAHPTHASEKRQSEPTPIHA